MLYKIGTWGQEVRTKLTLSLGPAWFRRAVITRVPSKAIKQLLSIVDVQHEQALQIFEQKKATLAYSHSAKHSGTMEKDMVTLMREFHAVLLSEFAI